jgi:hypothetical protein
LVFVSDWDERAGEVEIIFHKETNVDCSDGEEEVALVIFHLLYKLKIFFDKSENQLQGEDPTATKISFRMLALKAKFKPLLA